ncbi:TIGR01777 family oxidoreductase [Carnimonas bestiolae]|uniref:TIGR01777 family oxidoreductase n=1 Tax=Carnimonas bestiolae TaxID=3402172 RepID=UPI003EDC45A2
MLVLVSGATGFVGRRLCQQLHQQGHRIGVISRDPEQAAARIGVDVMARKSAEEFADQPIDAIVNLAGAPIFGKRWSEQRKRELIDSRVSMTRSLVALCHALAEPPRVMVSGSAMGFYGDQGDRDVDEHTLPHREFAHQLCHEWEQAAAPLANSNTRLVIVRLGLVLDPEGGMLKSLLPTVRLFAGAQLSDGRQYMPWISLQDTVRALLWLMENDSAEGVYNLSAPHPVRNRELLKALGRAVHRPVPWRVPGVMLKLGLGEMSRMLLTGAAMRPRRLVGEGFHFKHETLQQALAAQLE